MRFHRWAQQLCIVGVAAVVVVALAPSAKAHHHDNNPPGHSGYLYAPNHELNGSTVDGNSIPIQPGFAPADWGLHLTSARNNWNSALSPIAGFNVFSTGGNITVNAGNDTSFCGFVGGDASHGCLQEGWNFDAPSGGIYMYLPQFSGSDPNHKRSDLLHEMGHALYNAGEHYPGGGCISIIDHCQSQTITQHDKDDFSAAYRMIDAPNASYGQLTSSTNLRHFFEGAYYTHGNGLTLHAEKRYVLDRAVNNVGGSYTFYKDYPRIINHTNDTTPNFKDEALPPSNTEWCFKMRGETEAIANTAEGYRWSPQSRAYCVARSSNSVYSLSNRNDYALFRVWNYSGATINGLALLLPGTTTRICDFGNISNGSSPYCIWYAGNPSGYLEVWYNWQLQDTIGYGAR